MDEEWGYDVLVSSFQPKRHELLLLINEMAPRPADLHRRRWRVQQLENSISDLKETLIACNNQTDTERAKLDELNSQTDRLRAQELKLMTDVKILQGVTGLAAKFPSDATSKELDTINSMAEEFRSRFANFYFDLPPIKQVLEVDPTLESDSRILVETMKDFVRVQFDSRSTQAILAREASAHRADAKILEQQVKEKELRVEREIALHRKRIEDSADRVKETMEEQTHHLKKENARIHEELEHLMNTQARSTEDLAAQKKLLKARCERLTLRNQATKENFAKRAQEIEMELERLEKRIQVIRREPKAVDKKLVNMALILNQKTASIDRVVSEIRRDIAEFVQWVNKK